MALRPDYGYRNKVVLTTEELNNINDDGIWKVDFETGSQELLISIDDVYKAFPNKKMQQAIHKFNHVMISPNGQLFIFMHRYIFKGQRFDRLFVVSRDGSDLKLIADNKMVSHCFWRDDNTIFGYLRGKDGRNSYWLIDVNSGLFTEFKNELLALQGDGHPHVCGDYFITDTYPDKARMQKLLLGNFKTGNVKVIGQFFHGFNYSGETRCDLHPRFSCDGKSVFFDSVYSGKRYLCEMDVTL
jgi:Tol biopolymer transport system component